MIWTRVVMSISYDNYYYTTGTTCKLWTALIRNLLTQRNYELWTTMNYELWTALIRNLLTQRKYIDWTWNLTQVRNMKFLLCMFIYVCAWVFNWLPTKVIYDTKSFYSEKPHTNRVISCYFKKCLVPSVLSIIGYVRHQAMNSALQSREKAPWGQTNCLILPTWGGPEWRHGWLVCVCLWTRIIFQTFFV